jgi:hypothetical protein
MLTITTTLLVLDGDLLSCSNGLYGGYDRGISVRNGKDLNWGS